MQAHNPWENISDSMIKAFILNIWKTVASEGWDRPSSIRNIRIMGGKLTSYHPTHFSSHPAEFLEGRNASRHVDAVIVFFEGWSYPETLSKSEMEEQATLIRPSQHPHRVELRQALFMSRTGLTYSALQKKGEETTIEQVNIPGKQDSKEVSGIIAHAVRCYIQAPYYKEIPSPYLTWLRNIVGKTMSGVIDHASESKSTQDEIVLAAQDVAVLIDLGLNPDKAASSPAQKAIEELKEFHHAPSMESTWHDMRDHLILNAYLTQRSSRIKLLRWTDDAALQEVLNDFDFSNKARTLLSLLDDETTRLHLQNMLDLIDPDL